MGKTYTQLVSTRFNPPLNRPHQSLSVSSRLWNTWRYGVFVWVIFAAFLALVQFSTPDMPDNDGFYHIKLAYLMRNEGLKPEFPWLPLTILNPREFYDHHFLFHAALMPFTFGDLRLGAKWAAVFFASLAFLSVWNLLKNQRVPYAWLWSLGLLAVSEAFIYRMSITRAQSLSLAVLALGVNWLLQGRYKLLMVLAFAYVWLYDAFPLLIIFAGLYVFAGWLIEKRLDLRPVLFTGIGTALGLVFNPYFPHNIVFGTLHILPKLFETTGVSVGNEWYPYETAQLLKNSPLALAAFLGGGLALGLSGKRMDLRTAFSFFTAVLFGLMLFQSRRFIEYFPAFSLVFAAFAWTPLFEQTTKNGSENLDPVDPGPERKGLKPGFQPLPGNRFGKRLPAVALSIVLIPCAWFTFHEARASLQTSKPYGTYSSASAWLAENTQPGERVFQTDWDDFPRLFYYNSQNTYLVGLDPTYMLLYNAELYELWVDITRGEVEQPSGDILEEFGAQYILTDLLHGGFLERAEEDPGLMEVYRDGDAAIFRVIGY